MRKAMSVSVELILPDRVLEGVFYTGPAPAEVESVLPLDLELRFQEGCYRSPLRVPLALTVERDARALRPGELAYSPEDNALCIYAPATKDGGAADLRNPSENPFADPIGWIESDWSSLARLQEPIRATLRVRDTGTYTRAP